MKTFLPLLFALSLCSGTSQPWAEAKLPETLEECLELGLARSDRLQAAVLEAHIAAAKLGEMKAKRLPSLTLRSAYSRLSEEETGEITLPPPSSATIDLAPEILNEYSLGVSLKQPLFTGLHIRSSIEQSRHLSRASLQEVRSERNDLVYEIRTAFWSLMEARENLRIVEERIELVKVYLQDVKNRKQQGLSTRNDVLKVEMQLAEARLKAVEAGNALILSRARLNLLLGLPEDTVLLLRIQFRHQKEPPGILDPLLDEARKERPELRALHQHILAGEEGLTLNRSGWYPNLYLTGGYLWARPNPRLFPQEDRFEGTWELGLTASLDVGRWTALPHQTRQAVARLEQSRARLEALEDAVALEVIQSSLALTGSREEVEASSLMIQQAEESLRITREKFENGLALSSELLDEEIALLEARLKRFRARSSIEKAWASLQRAVGKSLETAGGSPCHPCP